MQIHFAKTFPWGNPTHFIEKIWQGLIENSTSVVAFMDKWPYTEMYSQSYPTAKIHTIREDKTDRWKAGKMIHFEQWTGKPYNSKCYHFAPLIPCMGVQEISIRHWPDKAITVWIDGRHFYSTALPENVSRMFELAKNDGFDSIDDFFKWFDKDFTGKIIHWTYFKYY